MVSTKIVDPSYTRGEKLNILTFYIGGEFCKATNKNSFINMKEFKNYLKESPISNSTVLIKGFLAKSTNTYIPSR